MAGEQVVFCTCPASEARRIAKKLVEDKLAACINILPGVVSCYVWNDEPCEEEESLLVIKSSRQLFEQLEQGIKKIHPYDVPEIIALPIEMGHKPYLDWLNSGLRESLEAGKET